MTDICRVEDCDRPVSDAWTCSHCAWKLEGWPMTARKTVALYLQDDDPANREFGCDEPYLDVRLTIPDDAWREMGEPEWIVVQITPSRAPRTVDAHGLPREDPWAVTGGGR